MLDTWWPSSLLPVVRMMARTHSCPQSRLLQPTSRSSCNATTGKDTGVYRMGALHTPCLSIPTQPSCGTVFTPTSHLLLLSGTEADLLRLHLQVLNLCDSHWSKYGQGSNSSALKPGRDEDGNGTFLIECHFSFTEEIK